MSDPSDKDRELDAYLSGNSPVSRAYQEQCRELPPAELDARILAQAHREDARGRTRRARSPFSGSWMVPASVTAVVLLAVSVAVLLPEGRPGHERQRDRFEDSRVQEAEPSGTEKARRRDSEEAPAAGYAPPPPSGSEISKKNSAADLQQAPPAAPAPEGRSLSPREARPSAAAGADRPRADGAAGPALDRSAAQESVGAADEEGLAGKAESEVIADIDAWLAHIGRLIDRGELEAARESLIEFRRAYPAAVVPGRISRALEGGGN